ncbi:MAG: AAA family ATPase [Methylovulum sp.]|uniref:AAA family ATPase n=1 Tax=Methylovulum sp. TaxID=1916980 RepID=UPI0026054C79|nr:AAA family ATPase [Methylovulum sp.]MDD2723100.1 AAA family ATPase [Methylovulum sp.]
MITLERTEKLDLLIHLINHLSSSIVVCGPKGIGKSTLLNALQEHPSASWQCCAISGTPELDMEALQQTIQQQATTTVTKAAATANKKTVLLIDEAGFLTPGLITSIIQYSTGKNQLRIVFALTPDELYLKNHSDSLVNECYVIEIPALSEKQCGEFLQLLASKPGGRISNTGLNDTVASSMYLKTHGVPGNIIANLPYIAHTQKKDRTLPILIAAVILLVTLTLGIQWRSQITTIFSQFIGHNQTNP